jgi:hypothetical protein
MVKKGGKKGERREERKKCGDIEENKRHHMYP